MAIFKCKMCSHYDGEWCRRDKLIKTRRSPCESCPECRIKLNEKMSFCPYKLTLPYWLGWLLARLGFSIAVIMTAFLLLNTAFFVIGAFATLLEGDILMTIHAIVTATVCLFLIMLCKRFATWLHDEYF